MGNWRIVLWRAAGGIAVALGTVGIVLPLLPTVVFYILAAFCFGKSNPEWEARLLRHRDFGPHILAWRERRAIARRGKIAALLAMSVSAAIGLLSIDGPARFVPLAVALIVGPWIWTRPDV
jgi:uncharacterized membrane protein YbaN (DUF454 family)